MTIGPNEMTFVQAPCSKPDAKSVVHQDLHARRALIGKQIRMVRPCGPKYLHHARKNGIGAGTHIERFSRKPNGVDADDRSTSRTQAALSLKQKCGHSTDTVVPLR